MDIALEFVRFLVAVGIGYGIGNMSDERNTRKLFLFVIGALWFLFVG